jgi:hypothetical protein
MKNFMIAVLAAVLCSAAFAQTEDYGLGVYANEGRPILLAVDAQAAIQQIDGPYVLFVVYMASKDQNASFVVSRNDVVIIYNGREYKMPSVEELRSHYGGGLRDIEFYQHLSRPGLISTWIVHYKFMARTDFFPPLVASAPLPVDEGSMTGTIGFATKCYFKNPGFKKGDTLIFRVRDKSRPEITAEVEVKLKS